MNYTDIQKERTLRRLAKPYYVEHGNNSWDHIKQVYTNANAMTQQIYGRPLTLSEKAAIFFHDSAVKSMGRKNHGQNAKDLAVPLLLSTGYFDQQQLDDIGQAILEHDTLDNKGGPFTSTTGEVLASGDTEPPDIPWMLNKMYGWHIRNTPNKADWKQGIYDSVKEYFGPDVNALQPPLYNKFHKDRRRIMKEQINSYSADELWDIVTKYRKKHHIGEDEIKYPNTTLLKAASNLYHASPKALQLLSGMTTKYGETGSVFVSPSKAHASLFALDRQGIVDAIEKQIGKQHIKVNNLSYGQWKDAPSDQPLDHADIYVDTDEKFEPFSGEQAGYLYTINAAPYAYRIKKWKHDRGDKEVLIQGDVVPDKVEPLALKYNVIPGKAPA